MRQIRRCKQWTILLLGVSLATPGWAQSNPNAAQKGQKPKLSAEAKADLEAARKLLLQSDFSGALMKYRQAYELSKDPHALWGMALCEKSMRHYARAVRIGGQALAEGESALSSKERGEVAELIAMAKASSGSLRLSVNEPGASVFVDDELVATTPVASPLVIDPGVRRLRVSKAGFIDFAKPDLAVTSGEVRVDVQLHKTNKTLTEQLTGDAKVEYEAAKLLYADGDYRGAFLKFQHAYELSNDPRLLWNMAACQKNLRRYSKVLPLVEKYQQDGGALLSEKDREDAVELAQTVKEFVSTVRLEVNEPDASVLVDDEIVGTTPLPKPVLVDIGQRHIRVTKPNFTDFEKTEVVSGANEIVLVARLERQQHQGRVLVVAGAKQVIAIDGKPVGTERWEGTIESGVHIVRVTGAGQRPFQADITVQDNEQRRLDVSLESNTPGSASGASWGWLGGGALVAAGLAVGGYFLLRPKDHELSPTPGTIQPGTIQLPLQGRSAR